MGIENSSDHVAERLRRFVVNPPDRGNWLEENYMRAAQEGKARHEAVCAYFGIHFSCFSDAVRYVEPKFELSPADQARAKHVEEVRPTSARFIWFYLRWERCVRTRAFPNPYEPWLDLCERGGAFRVERQEWIDVYAPDGSCIGAVCVASADAVMNRNKELERQAAFDVLMTDRRCPHCEQPAPSYRRTCKRCRRGLRDAVDE